MDAAAQGLDVENPVQEAFFEDDGFGGAEFMTAGAADAGFAVQFLSGGSQWRNGGRFDRAAVLAAEAFDAFFLYDKWPRHDLCAKPFKSRFRKRKDAHDVGRSFN